MTPLVAGPRPITATEFRAISDLLRGHTGIRLVTGKETLVMGRLDKRLRQLGIATYGEYLRLLAQPGHADETRQLIDLLTTNETYFFREERHFNFLRDVVLPEYQSRRQGGRPLRVWSAASSSGEEAYTAAMVLAEGLPDGSWEVTGTDISSRVVRSAQQGIYPIEAAERIPGPMLRRYCRKGRDEYAGMMAIGPELRAHTSFQCANLLAELPPLGRFDVILLRNVMIYFDSETRARLVPRLQELLQPGGYFIVSLSETLNGISSRLRVVEPSIYRLAGAERV